MNPDHWEELQRKMQEAFEFKIPTKTELKVGRFASPPAQLKWSDELSALYTQAWRKLNEDWMTYTGKELESRRKELEYKTIYEDAVKRS